MEGYQNEFDFVLALNNKTKKELNNQLQELVYFLFGKIPEDAVIKSWRNKEPQKVGDNGSSSSSSSAESAKKKSSPNLRKLRKI